MDLSNFIPTKDTIEVVLKHPVTDEVLTKDDGKPMVIVVNAPHSPKFKAVVHEQANKRLKKASKGKVAPITAEEWEESMIEGLAKTTESWDIQMNGKSVKFSLEAVIDLYNKLPWVKEQVQAAQEDYTSFLKV